MFTIAITNMILRGNGKSNIECEDCFKFKSGELQLKGATVGMLNPPYSLAKKKKNSSLYEICFIEHMLNSLTLKGRAIAIIPQSSGDWKDKIINKTKEIISE